jgi:hypothetical protein
MVTLKALAAAITQVEKLRDHEFTFEAGGMEITLRPLRSQEETEVQRYAQVAWEGVGADGDTAAYQEFMDRVRKSTLGFSIIRLGPTDLHGVSWIDTGERDEKGNPISVPKWEAIRDLISEEWSKAFLLQVFSKFGELLERVEISASKLVKFDPVDLDEEISRLEKRVADLKSVKEVREHPEQSTAQRAQKAVGDIDRRHSEIRNEMRSTVGPTAAAERTQRAQEAQEALIQDEEPPSAPQTHQAASQPTRQAAPPAPTQAPQGRRSAIPQPQEEAAPGVGMPQEQVPEPSPPPSPTDEQGIELPHDGDSFFDPADPDAALEAEARRQSHLHQRNLQRAREKKMQQQRAEELGVPTSADLARQRMRAQQESGKPQATRLDVDPRTQGLREAANLNDQIADAGAGRIRSGRPQAAAPSPVQGRGGGPAQLHGKPVYKMPAQTLDRPERARQHGESLDSPMQINPPGGAANPKFRGPPQQ